ncbi:MAG: S1 RNA-binding domain-containing protein [Chloroflexi bacterium]|nr:MAG: S1 RNA-binding domain-containing protein [Chloroflexota bacterium]
MPCITIPAQIVCYNEPTRRPHPPPGRPALTQGSSRLSIGDKVLVFIVQPESPEGQIILSLDRARGERGWRVLQDYMDRNEAFEAYITGSNKGGLLVNVEGVNAFVPLSQLVSGPDRASPENTQNALSQWVGKTITLKVIELNRRRNRAILSERAAVQEKRAAEKERLLLELEEGDVKTGTVTSIRDFGIFVDIGGADGLVHLSELSWERTPKSPHELFSVGDHVPVYVLKIDNESKKIALSVRRAQPERWEEIVSNYREGQIVPGQVTKLAPFGAFVRLEGPIEGLIHISELVDRRINHPREVVDENDVVPVKIVRIEYDRHRLGLSLRQARDKAEEDGWSFNETGNVLSAPQEALDRLGVTAPPAREAAPDTVASEVDVAAAGDLGVVDAEAETPVAAPTAEAAEDAAPELAQEAPAEAEAAPELTEEEPAEAEAAPELTEEEPAEAEAAPESTEEEPVQADAAPELAQHEPAEAEAALETATDELAEPEGESAPEPESVPVAEAASEDEVDASGPEASAEPESSEPDARSEEAGEEEVTDVENDKPGVTDEESPALNTVRED